MAIGGKRKGAGRHPVPNKKIKKCITLRPDHIEKMAGGKASWIIEKALDKYFKGDIMKTIRDTKLFNEISDLTETDNQAWSALFDDESEKKNPSIPVLVGGLDHVDRKEKGIYFHDIGCNGKDNSFVIRPE